MKWFSSLIFLFSLNVFGADEVKLEKSFKDWATYSTPDSQMAATFGQAGEIMSVVCRKTGVSCFASFSLKTTCNDSAEIPILFTSKEGSGYLISKCRISNDSAFLDILDYQILISGLSKPGLIGFAIALDGGQFRVIRFKTDGAIDAINYLIKTRSQYALPSTEKL